MTTLLDILKETDLRTGFTDIFKSLGIRESLDRSTLQPRLLLCLYGLGAYSTESCHPNHVMVAT
jgi:hypothetical protein